LPIKVVDTAQRGGAATKILLVLFLLLLLDSEHGERKRRSKRTIKFVWLATIPRDTDRLKSALRT
jgi:hypothetical protein